LTAHRGFTLLELIVTIAVAGVIALLVYGTAQAGFDTRDRLARHPATTEAELRGRALLADAIRHASDEADPGTDAFTLDNAVDGRGLPADQLVFLSRGITPPLGASPLWRVQVAVTAGGLRIDAVRATGDPASGGALLTAPASTEPPQAPFTAVLPSIRGFDARAMSLADGVWLESWPSRSQLPAAVRIVFHDAQGTIVGAPLIARVGLEGLR
jgi:prepilin-type N-terminal cleavage/methylation domain-containing protein